VISAIGFAVTGYNWAHGGYVALPSVLPITLAAVTGAIGCQSIMGGFLLAIIAGHKAQIVTASAGSRVPQATECPPRLDNAA